MDNAQRLRKSSEKIGQTARQFMIRWYRFSLGISHEDAEALDELIQEQAIVALLDEAEQLAPAPHIYGKSPIEQLMREAREKHQ